MSRGPLESGRTPSLSRLFLRAALLPTSAYLSLVDTLHPRHRQLQTSSRSSVPPLPTGFSSRGPYFRGADPQHPLLTTSRTRPCRLSCIFPPSMPAAVACVKSLPDEPQSAHRCPHGSPSSLPKTGMGPSRPLQQTVRDSCSRAQDGTLRPGPCLPSAPRPHGAAPTFLPNSLSRALSL